MNIGELALKSGVSKRMIRYYEEQGLLTPARSDSNYRSYSQDDVCRLGRICILQEAGLTLKVIHSLLPCVNGEPIRFEQCPLVTEILMAEKNKMDQRIRILSESQAILESYIIGTGAPSREIAGRSGIEPAANERFTRPSARETAESHRRTDPVLPAAQDAHWQVQDRSPV